jgi:hypothetical protein
MTPRPRFGAIDYSTPPQYLFLSSSFVGPESIQDLATSLQTSSPQATLGAIWKWMKANLEERNVMADYGWRPVSEILARRRYIGCADLAMVYGCLARACGIPVVWVKSMDVNWIRMFYFTGRFNGGKGHVFLEAYLEGKWQLVNASQNEVYKRYNPSFELLPGPPGDRFAYDKGGDPRGLVLSLDWEPWKAQTREYFSSFDLGRLKMARRAWEGDAKKLCFPTSAKAD